jgi:hypothetical protein
MRPADTPDWLIRQRTLLLDASDGDMAIRHLLALAWDQLAAAEARTLDLEAQLLVAQAPAVPFRAVSWRPQICDLLRARGAPMAAAAITQALDAPRSLADICRHMATAGLLIRTDGLYALPKAETPPAAARGGRPRKAAP